jgi:hypothetical protein
MFLRPVTEDEKISAKRGFFAARAKFSKIYIQSAAPERRETGFTFRGAPELLQFQINRGQTENQKRK